MYQVQNTEGLIEELGIFIKKKNTPEFHMNSGLTFNTTKRGKRKKRLRNARM